MTKATSWRRATTGLLAAALLGFGLGCTPATTGTSSAPSRTTTQPDKKNDSVKPPKPDPG
jgi:hypothetical protein